MFYLATNNNQNEDGDGNDISASVKQREVSVLLKNREGLAKMVTFRRTWSVSSSQSAFSPTQEHRSANARSFCVPGMRLCENIKMQLPPKQAYYSALNT